MAAGTIPARPTVLSDDQFKLSTRQVSRRLARDSLGVAVSGTMSIVMPWMIIPTALSVRRVYRNGKAFNILTKADKHLSKRQILRGVMEGTIIKTGTVALTLGHDDILVGLNEIFEQAPDQLDTLQGIALADEDRVGHSFIEFTTGAASAPAEAVQELLHLDTTEGLAESGTNAYDAPASEIAAQVLYVGAVQAGAEKISDTLLEKPFDAAVDHSGNKRINSTAQPPTNNYSSNRYKSY